MPVLGYLNEHYEHLKERLGDRIPDFELRMQAEIAKEVMQLKKDTEKNRRDITDYIASYSKSDQLPFISLTKYH